MQSSYVGHKYKHALTYMYMYKNNFKNKWLYSNVSFCS